MYNKIFACIVGENQDNEKVKRFYKLTGRTQAVGYVKNFEPIRKRLYNEYRLEVKEEYKGFIIPIVKNGDIVELKQLEENI